MDDISFFILRSELIGKKEHDIWANVVITNICVLSLFWLISFYFGWYFIIVSLTSTIILWSCTGTEPIVYWKRNMFPILWEKETHYTDKGLYEVLND